MTRQKDDFYPTPLIAIEALLDHENFDGDIWEPACGDGAISAPVSLYHNVISTQHHNQPTIQAGPTFYTEGY